MIVTVNNLNSLFWLRVDPPPATGCRLVSLSSVEGHGATPPHSQALSCRHADYGFSAPAGGCNFPCQPFFITRMK